MSRPHSSSTPANLCRLVGAILIIQFALTLIVAPIFSESNVVEANTQQHLTGHYSTPSLFARILQHPANVTSSVAGNSSQLADLRLSREKNDLNELDEDEQEEEDDDEEVDGEDDEEELDQEDDEEELDDEGEDVEVGEADDDENSKKKKPTDLVGAKLEPKNAGDTRTSMVVGNKPVAKTTARDLGLLTLKAILLGPLIGLTIKAALIRGLLYAVFAYGLHLFFPALLSTLGLGTGLVGFARQLQPNYAQLLVPHLMNLQHALPSSFQKLASQYQQVLSPVVESIRAIPEGHCRYRAVCETASQLIRQSRSMSVTLQRISATVYTQFGSDYSKAWLDGVVQSDCAAKYAQCPMSPFSLVAGRLAQALGGRDAIPMLGGGGAAAAAGGGGAIAAANVADLGSKV